MDRSESSDVGRLAVDNILSHHGILGMHWGHRKPEGVTVSPGSVEGTNVGDPRVPVTLYSKPGKGIIKTSGGQGRLPSEDMKNAAAYKQIANQSSTHALSSKELQHLVNRINLEQQYSKLANAPKKHSAGYKFVSNLLKNEGKQLMSGKQGPVIKIIGNTLDGSGGSHRSNAYPVGVFKKSYATSKHRP